MDPHNQLSSQTTHAPAMHEPRPNYHHLRPHDLWEISCNVTVRRGGGGALGSETGQTPRLCALCGVPWNGKYGHFNLHISFELDVIDYCLTFRILSTSFVHLAYFVLV